MYLDLHHKLHILKYNHDATPPRPIFAESC
jgi:hypothetical protein